MSLRLKAASALPLLTILYTFPLLGTAKVEAIRILNAPPPSCQSAFASPPTSVAYIATTDASAYLWFSVSGVAVGDLIQIEMYQPDGK